MSAGLTKTQTLLQQHQAIQNLDENAIAPAPTFSGRNRWLPGLTWVCVLFVLIGITGGISAFFEAKNLFLGTEVAALDIKPRNAAERRFKMQAEKMQKSMVEVQKKYFPVLTYMLIFKLAMCISFLLAVGFLVTNNPKARKFALYVCGFAIFYHVSLVAVSILIVAPSSGPVFQMMQSILDDAGRQAGASAAERKEMMAAAQSGMAIGMSFAFLVVLAIKGTFYGIIMAYLGRPEVKNLFGERLIDDVAVLAAVADAPIQFANARAISGFPSSIADAKRNATRI